MSKKNRAWIPVWAIIIASVLIAFEYGKVPPAAPTMMEVLGISYTTQGLMMTMFSIAAVVMALFGGALITETLFGIQGIGFASYYSMVEADIPFTMFYLAFISLLTLLGNLLADILYAVVDPRVRLS